MSLYRGVLAVVCVAAFAVGVRAAEQPAADRGLVGYWTLIGDCKDHSGNGHHAKNHGAKLDTSDFSGQDCYLEVPDAPTLRFGTGDFALSAVVSTPPELTDVAGDLVTKFDPARRKGLNLTINASAPGYNGPSNARHLFFGLDNDSAGKWTDCGRPGGKTHISDALTVFNGDLYAGTTDGLSESDWAHVYRYKGTQDWEDCGRLGTGKTRGVYAMIVHDGALYAATSASHGGQPATVDFGHVYRYRGGQDWEDIGQPGANYRLNSLASFQGKLYVTGFNIGPDPGHCYAYEGGTQWKPCGEFKGWPHSMAVNDGRLYVGYPQGEVYAYDGNAWENLGNPLGTFSECNQVHSLGVYQGELYMGSWPKGKVAVLRKGKWVDLGRLGDATEVIALTVYNGSFYAGSIPRAEVFRFDGDGGWTSMRKLFDPPGYVPVPVGSGAKAVEDWSRASSLAVFQGKLFASTATCYRTMLDSPPKDDIRGKVYSFATGAAVSVDKDLGPGWKHVAAVRERRELKIYVDGELAATSPIEDDKLDIACDAPLRIGFGPQAHFCGKIRDVRLFNRAISKDEVRALNVASKDVRSN